jgi:DNA-binding transcriptional MerR regulator
MTRVEPEAFYKPAEACKIAEVAPYVLRYWETEFPALAESKEKGGGKLYSARDVKIIARIRELLYDEGFTVAGAKKRLESEISEGRFDDGLSPAPSTSEQKRSAKIAAAAAAVEASEPLFLSESRPPAGSSAASAPAPRAAPTDFPERKRVIRELKEIARILERSHRS